MRYLSRQPQSVKYAKYTMKYEVAKRDKKQINLFVLIIVFLKNCTALKFILHIKVLSQDLETITYPRSLL